MIRYSKSWYGLPSVFRILGSALPRALPFAIAAGVVAYVMRVYAGDYLVQEWRHPFPYQAIAFIVGFMVTFRCNLGYARYWEGCTNATIMAQRFADAAVQVVTFDVGNLPDDATNKQLAAAASFRDTYLHLTSLLHATALQELSQQVNVSNFVQHNSLAGDPESGDDGAAALTSDSQEHHGMLSWVDLFVLRGGQSIRAKQQRAISLPVLGGLRHEEAVALGAIDDDSEIFSCQEDVQGFLLENGMYAPGKRSRVHTVMAWLQQSMMERLRHGGLQAPAPLLTRMYQLLSEGMMGYEQARKLVRVPFPFPHAQMVTFTLLLFTFTLPLMICAFIENALLAAWLSMMTQLIYWGTNEVARELEDPFLIWSSTYNCLPFSSMQWKYNEDLIAYTYAVKPPEAARPNGLFASSAMHFPVRRYRDAFADLYTKSEPAPAKEGTEADKASIPAAVPDQDGLRDAQTAVTLPSDAARVKDTLTADATTAGGPPQREPVSPQRLLRVSASSQGAATVSNEGSRAADPHGDHLPGLATLDKLSTTVPMLQRHYSIQLSGGGMHRSRRGPSKSVSSRRVVVGSAQPQSALSGSLRDGAVGLGRGDSLVRLAHTDVSESLEEPLLPETTEQV